MAPRITRAPSPARSGGVHTRPLPFRTREGAGVAPSSAQIRGASVVEYVDVTTEQLGDLLPGGACVQRIAPHVKEDELRKAH